jgi:hypothetical protein
MLAAFFSALDCMRVRFNLSGNVSSATAVSYADSTNAYLELQYHLGSYEIRFWNTNNLEDRPVTPTLSKTGLLYNPSTHPRVFFLVAGTANAGVYGTPKMLKMQWSN